MDAVQYASYLDILKKELIPALGCTEPIAVAYAAAKAVQILGEFPESIQIRCSGNIIKNAKGAAVPNSGGMKGINAAAVLGAVGGDASKELEVLESVTASDRENAWGGTVAARACARAAAGSDARMGGCSMPVVINSGSGNQGIAVSMPVLVYAQAWEVSEEKLYRALVVSNLTAVHQKYYIGGLSAYCGAVCSACGVGAGITYMYGGDYRQVSATIINTLGNVGGIICDGAKPSCAAKIASSVNAAIMAFHLSMENKKFLPGDGIVEEDVEETIKAMGYIGRVGMRQTDQEILKVMTGWVDVG